MYSGLIDKIKRRISAILGYPPLLNLGYIIRIIFKYAFLLMGTLHALDHTKLY